MESDAVNELQTKLEVRRASADLVASPAQLPETTASRVAVFTKLSPSALIPYARYGAQKLGHAGIIGLSFLIFSVAAFFSTNTPLHDQVLSQSAALENARDLAGSQQSTGGGNDPFGAAQQLVRELPSRDDLPEIMGQIVTVAAAAGLSLDRGNYEFTATESGDVSRYRLNLPVRGSYPQVRAFIENTLAAVPVASLESMRVERNEVTDRTIAADLKFAVLVGSKK
jgi:hypothetical protein